MALTVRGATGLGVGLQAVYGIYSHTAGAAEETLAVTGGAVYLLTVNGQLAANTAHQTSGVSYTTSQSGAILTITIAGLATVTAGTFYCIVGSAA